MQKKIRETIKYLCDKYNIPKTSNYGRMPR